MGKKHHIYFKYVPRILNFGTQVVWSQHNMTLYPRASARPERGRGPARLSHECIERCRSAKSYLCSEQISAGHVTAPQPKLARIDPNVSGSWENRPRYNKESLLKTVDDQKTEANRCLTARTIGCLHQTNQKCSWICSSCLAPRPDNKQLYLHRKGTEGLLVNHLRSELHQLQHRPTTSIYRKTWHQKRGFVFEIC